MYWSEGRNRAPFLLSLGAGRHFGVLLGAQCRDRNLISIVTVVRVELCSAAFSQAAHWSQIGLTQNEKVSLHLCAWNQERMLDQENDVSLTFLYWFSGV